MSVQFYSNLGWLLLAGGLCLLLAFWQERALLDLLATLFGPRRFTLALYALLTLPGFFIHEGAHALMALLLGIPIRGITLIPRWDAYDRSLSASVQVARRDRLRMALFALAPLLVGAVALGLLSGTLSPSVSDPLPWSRLTNWVHNLDRQSGGFWPTVYLIWTISSHMAPSRVDLRLIKSGALALLALILLIGLLLPLLWPVGSNRLGMALGHLGDGLAVGALLNAIFFLPLAGLVYLLGRR